MTRTILERELQKLQDEILRLGSEIEENLIKVVDAFVRRDMVRSQQLINADEWINERRITVMTTGLGLIATQQPMASDMRVIAAIIEIAGELERIHDYVKGIGRINLMIGEKTLPAWLTLPLTEITQKAAGMLHTSMDAFADHDVSLCQTLPRRDDEVDALYQHIYQRIIQYYYRDENNEDNEIAGQLEWVIHNIERAADRTLNICEWVIYVGTGKFAELDEAVKEKSL